MARASLIAVLAVVSLQGGVLALGGSPENSIIRPGVAWFDTSGARVYAGGANIYHENGVYYLIGEGKKVYSDCSKCFNLYSSTDLASWTFLGCALNNSDIKAPLPPQGYFRMERPKLFKCPTLPPSNPNPYRLIFHCDSPSFTLTSIGILSAPFPTGPFTFTSPCFEPDGQPSYDMGVFVDDGPAGDGHAYLVRSVRNQFAGISQLNDDCTNTTGIVSQGPDMEGQAIMRDAQGTLHLMGSHLTGWAPNAMIFVTSPNSSLVGAVWQNASNPTGDGTSYDSQSTFILPYTHADGHTTYMYMGDRWNEAGPGGLDNATLIWLPLLPPNGTQPLVGAELALVPCDASDPTQQFTLTPSSASVRHVSSGLCVSQSSADGTLQLATCAACPSGGCPQSWAVRAAPGGGWQITNGSAGCVDMNNANQIVSPGNPVIAWPCGSPPAWNELWSLSGACGPGAACTTSIRARSQAGGDAGTCIGVAAPSGWTIPWLDSWSLGQY